MLKARIAGGLWLVTIATSAFAFGSMSALIVRGDPAATATTVLANEALFRVSFFAELVAGLCYVAVTVLLYELLKPVNRSLSLLAAFFGLGGVAIGGAALLSRLASLVLLRGEPYSSAFTRDQLQPLALTSLELHDVFVFHVGLAFFGIQCSIAGYLILRSSFLPWLPGSLLAIGGASYLIGSFAISLAPSFAAPLLPYVLPFGVVGEGCVSLWLLIRGLDASRWSEEAGGMTGR